MHRPSMSFRAPGLPAGFGQSLRANALRIAVLTLAGRKQFFTLGARQVRRALGGPAGRMAAASALHLGFLGLARRQRRAAPPARGRGSASIKEFGAPGRRATDFLMLLNAAAFIAQFATNDRLLLWGAKDNQLIRSGQWWRFITPVFLHANLMHLVANNYSLNSLGPPVEALTGRQRFISVYAASALVGSMASYAFNSSPSVGASGAIFGLGGALAVYAARHRAMLGKSGDAILSSLGQSLALNVVIGLTSPRIDQWGHFGGLVGGALTAYLLGPCLRVVEGRDRRRRLIDSPPVPIFASKL